MAENRPTEHIGQEDIERDRGGTELPCQGKTHCAFGGDDPLEALISRQPQENAGEMRIVLNDENHEGTLLNNVAIVLDVLFAMGKTASSRVADDEPGATADLQVLGPV